MICFCGYTLCVLLSVANSWNNHHEVTAGQVCQHCKLDDKMLEWEAKLFCFQATGSKTEEEALEQASALLCLNSPSTASQRGGEG